MKTVLSLFTVAAVLLTGCGTAASASPEPASTSVVSTTDHLTPTGTAVPCNPDDCDPDEGEEISPEELAEINAAILPAAAVPLEDQPGWDCNVHGNASCDPTRNAGLNIGGITEDDPRWNCYEHGNRICGPATEGLAVEAWDKFNPEVFPADKLAQSFKVTYHGTAPAGADLPPSQFHTVAASKAGLSHVFTVEFGATK